MDQWQVLFWNVVGGGMMIAAALGLLVMVAANLWGRHRESRDDSVNALSARSPGRVHSR